MNQKSIVKTARPLLSVCKQLGLALILIMGVSQQALAQQGSECLLCHTGLPATEFNLIDQQTPEVQPTSGCDYTFAADFDGWGWNAARGESCPPIDNNLSPTETSASCDYSSASQFDGWGWDPVNNTSCPPQDPHARFPICSATYFDADGDGFGWENEASCIITSDSAPPPVFTNQQTGNQVDLVRAYWDGNTDLADRVVQCDLYYYDSYSMIYRTENFPFRAGAGINNQVFPSYRFQHLALPPESPYQGFIADIAYVDNGEVISTALGTKPHWTTNDGRYIGPTVLQDPYLEVVTRSNGAKAVRMWVNSRQDTALNLRDSGNRVRRDGYFECYDIAGRDLQPTGVMGGGTTSPRVLSDLVLTAEELPNQQDPAEIVNLYTGNQVTLKKAYWNYNKDLGGKSFNCQSKLFIGCETCPNDYINTVSYDFTFANHFTNSGNRIHFTSGPDLVRTNESLLFENGVMKNTKNFTPVLFNSPYVEETAQGVRFWYKSDTYTECQGISPTGTAPTIINNNQCDYSNAGSYDGWGWNRVTRTSCPPQTQSTSSTPVINTPVTNTSTSNCDYSNAAAFDGWGWNPVTSTSCAPQTASANNCDYSNAGPDGWGWDPVARVSCQPR